MGSDQRQQLMEQYEDAAFALLMDEYAEAEGAKLLQEFKELEQAGAIPEIPATLNKKLRQAIDSAFAEQKRKHSLKQISRFAAKAAAIFLVVLGLSTVTVLSVDAFRVPVLNFVLDRSGEFSKVVTDDRAENQIDSTSATIMRFKACLPEGYQERQNSISNGSGHIYCENSSNSVISLNISPADTGLVVDTEDSEFTAVKFDDFTAAFQEKNGYHLMWIGDDESIYILYASELSIEEFWELAYAIAD